MSKFGAGVEADVLVRRTVDGVPLVQLWQEIQEIVQLYQAEKNSIIGLLTYRTTNFADAIPTSLTPQTMEEASEFGVAKSIRPDAPHLLVGYDMKDYDLASNLSFKFLRSATAEQIRAVIARMIEADQHTIQLQVLAQVFGPTTRRNEFDHTVYPLFNGSNTADNKPVDVMGRSFDASHNHFIPTGSVDLDAEDVTLLAAHVREHGFGRGGRSGKLVMMMNPDDVEDSGITGWRAGVVTNNAKVSRYDFVVSPTAPPYLTDKQLVGEQPPADFEGIPVIGSYGPISYVVQSEVIPAGYLAIAATHGLDHPDNAVAWRQPADPEYQGLLFFPGEDDKRAYPLSRSYSFRSFGTGVRRRGAAVVAQLAAAGSYTAPTAFAL